jgi:hypothetical protein
MESLKNKLHTHLRLTLQRQKQMKEKKNKEFYIPPTIMTITK